MPAMPLALPRAPYAPERQFPCALPDLRESGIEENIGGLRRRADVVSLEEFAGASLPVRTLPAQIFFRAADARIGGGGKSFLVLGGVKPQSLS